MSKPFWIVAPMNVTEAQGRTGNRVGQQLNINVIQAAPARRDERTRRRDEPMLEEAQVPQQENSNGYGYVPDPAWLKKITHVFTTPESADAYATELAEKNPKILFGVFGVGNTYETTTPTVITKTFNADGELVVKS